MCHLSACARSLVPIAKVRPSLVCLSSCSSCGSLPEGPSGEPRALSRPCGGVQALGCKSPQTVMRIQFKFKPQYRNRLCICTNNLLIATCITYAAHSPPVFDTNAVPALYRNHLICRGLSKKKNNIINITRGKAYLQRSSNAAPALTLLVAKQQSPNAGYCYLLVVRVGSRYGRQFEASRLG